MIFGQNLNHADAAQFPVAPYSAIRLWDTRTSWEEINTAPGTYDWAVLDQWLATAKAASKDVLYCCGRTPKWATAGAPSDYNAWSAGVPSDLNSGNAHWKSFITALASRYQGQFVGYELWNEPSRSKSWAGTVQQLAIMAMDATSIIRNFTQNAWVVSPSPTGSAPQNWFKQYIAAGGPFDACAFHAYVGADVTLLGPICDAMKALAGGKPMWVTEGSWNTNDTIPDSAKPDYVTAWHQILHDKGVVRAYWYSLDAKNNGTLMSNGALTPAGVAYEAIAQKLGTPTQPPGQTITMKLPFAPRSGDKIVLEVP